MTDFTDVLVKSEGIHECIMEVGCFFGSMLKNFFFLHNFEYSEGGSAAYGVTGIGVAVHKLLAFVVIVIEGIVNLVCGAHNSHRQVTAGECFTDSHDIWGDTGMVAGEHFACSAEAGSNFVGNQQYAVFITELT